MWQCDILLAPALGRASPWLTALEPHSGERFKGAFREGSSKKTNENKIHRKADQYPTQHPYVRYLTGMGRFITKILGPIGRETIFKKSDSQHTYRYYAMSSMGVMRLDTHLLISVGNNVYQERK